MFIWNSEKRRYESADGEPVPDSVLRRWVDDFAAALVVLFMARAQAVQSALVEINTGGGGDRFRAALADWQINCRADLRAGHLAACAIAFGGFNVIRSDQLETGERAADFHSSFWDNFVAGVFVGSVLMDGNFVPRSGMYGAGVYSTFQNGTRARERAAGMTQERRRLGASDHCPTCLEQAAFGWVAIGTLRSIGDSECKTRCRCYFQFK
jgi:hypothetical protein